MILSSTKTTRSRGPIVVAAVLLLCGVGRAWAGAEEGKAVYDKQCKVCHSIAGEGGKMANTGGALDHVAAKRDEAWLRAYLHDPKSKVENSKMAKLVLPDQQIDDLIAFLLTLK
jgi:cytochrome c2